ncbi:MAG: type IV pilus modification PilV family protein [Deltaproteobacteria bacterium]
MSRHDRGFSLIEAMVASVVMLVGLLGLAGLQITGMRANHLGKRMAQASLLARDLVQNMQIWQYADPRLTPVSHPALYADTNASDIRQYWDSGRAVSPAVRFDYTDGADASGAQRVGQLDASYEGVLSPTDSTLPAGEQVIFSRYWNVFNLDLNGSGTAQGKLVQVVVRWNEANLGYRQVTTSFFKYDPAGFTGL